MSSRSLSPSEQPRTALSGRACELSTVSEVAALPHVDSARLRSTVMRPATSTGESTAESQQVCTASLFNQLERSFTALFDVLDTYTSSNPWDFEQNKVCSIFVVLSNPPCSI